MLTTIRTLFAGALSLVLATSAFALPDIVFVTQPPHPADFATANATFGSHRASLDSIPRGGDLYIRYGNGTLKNITRSAGFGTDGFQGATGIAVRDPAVHWSGTKVVFSMVIGAPAQRYQVQSYRFQLYEATNLGISQTPVVTRVSNQPSEYNNVMPAYGTDGKIIFVSDRPQGGQAHTYPQRDEYESTATNTGLWSLDPTNGDLRHLDHSPSGDFSPSIDSFGRVIFIRWDHMQRDQQNRCSNQGFGAFNFSSESPTATALDSDAEVFPEARGDCDIAGGPDPLERHTFNHFLPWQIREDGTEIETINHIGRHELVSYIPKSFKNDPSVEEYYGQYTRVNAYSVTNLFQIRESAASPGTYIGISAPEFGTHASGQIVSFHAPPNRPADQVSVTPITHPDTDSTDDTPGPDHSGLSRDPAVLSDGTLVAAHTTSTLPDTNIGSSNAPQSRYAYRLKSFSPNGQYSVPTATLTSGIQATVSFWSPDNLVSYANVTMWELQPQELSARPVPNANAHVIPQPETNVFQSEGVDIQAFKDYLRENNLALIVSRNVTRRDNLDRQQPLNLRVAGSTTETRMNSGILYEIAHFQIFQGDLIRGYGGLSSAQAGRRVLAQPLHSVSQNPANSSGPAGSVQIASDGSVAAFVPAQRALTYQSTDAAGSGVVRERLWLTFQPGEIRVCGSCHGVNTIDQAGGSPPENEPEALRTLLQHWKGIPQEEISMVLAVSSNAKKKRSALQAGSRVKIAVTGSGSRSANKRVRLSLKAGTLSCGDIGEYTTSGSGTLNKTTRPVPHLPKAYSLQFSLSYAGRILDQKSIKAARSSRPKVRAKKVCEALIKAFK